MLHPGMEGQSWSPPRDKETQGCIVVASVLERWLGLSCKAYMLISIQWKSLDLKSNIGWIVTQAIFTL